MVASVNFNPRPLCRGRLPREYWRQQRIKFQSTPPMQGATTVDELLSDNQQYFNPRPLCRGRPLNRNYAAYTVEFQSTPPMQGATQLRKPLAVNIPIFQSTPPMQGATLPGIRFWRLLWNFNPRPLCRGRQGILQGKSVGQIAISIHAPYAGGDSFSACSLVRPSNFNPRPLCRGRRDV